MIGADLVTRDLLQDFEWFADREEATTQSLARLAERIASGQAPKNPAEFEARNFARRYARFRARYSAGVALETIAPEVRWLLDRVGGRPIGLRVALEVGSLGLLFGVVDGEEDLQTIFPGTQSLYETQADYHSITDWVLGVESRPEGYGSPEQEKGPQSIWKVIDPARAGELSAAKSALETFVNEQWIPEHLNGLPLDPQHHTFHGEWCWVGALAAVRYGIDDSALVGTAHWPSDLVAAARAGTVFPRTSDRDYDAPMLRDWAASRSVGFEWS